MRTESLSFNNLQINDITWQKKGFFIQRINYIKEWFIHEKLIKSQNYQILYASKIIKFEKYN